MGLLSTLLLIKHELLDAKAAAINPSASAALRRTAESGSCQLGGASSLLLWP